MNASPVSAGFFIGPHRLPGALALAPMAGVTDKPFRALCRQWGAAYAVSEMISAQPALRTSRKSRQRTDFADESAPVAVQLLGNDPDELAQAARYSVDRGAYVIDLNMGCPARKVYSKAAGAALLADEARVARILNAVTRAVAVPVTLKFRTGIAPETRNAVRIAGIAEEAGIALLALHGRTRACGFSGSAEYATIAAVKRAVSIPVLANGDIDSPAKALAVLRDTGADGVMIGRAALGQPWLFRDIAHLLARGTLPVPLTLAERHAVIVAHLEALYDFYGEAAGVRIARKHLHHYLRRLAPPSVVRQDGADSAAARAALNGAVTVAGQCAALSRFIALCRADRETHDTPCNIAYPKVA